MKKQLLFLVVGCLLCSYGFGFDLLKPIKSKTKEVKRDIVYSFIKEVVHLKAFAQMGKVTNGDHWINIGARGTINLQRNLDFKFGVSEYLDNPRGTSWINVNHKAIRADLGLFYKFADNLSIGYIYSLRVPIEGYSNTNLDNEFTDTREMIEVRYTL